MSDGWFLVRCCYYITTGWVTSKLKTFFLIASDFYLGFVRKMVKRRFTTWNVSAGNKSRVECTCNRAWGQSADSCKVRVKFKAFRNLKFVYPTNVRSTAARLLRLWVRIPPGAWMSVVSIVCFLVEVSASGWSLVQRSPTDCGASLCVI
jgi:hypothetical protein